MTSSKALANARTSMTLDRRSRGNEFPPSCSRLSDGPASLGGSPLPISASLPTTVRPSDEHAALGPQDGTGFIRHALHDASIRVELGGEPQRPVRWATSINNSDPPSALEITFCATTRTSPERSASPDATNADSMSSTRSSPAWTSPMPSTGMIRIVTIWSVLPPGIRRSSPRLRPRRTGGSPKRRRHAPRS